jgi:actin-related protein
MAATPIEIPIKLNGLAAIKAELRELKGDLANATDPKQMQELAQRAGELKDQLADANEQVAVFASGSKFEQVSNSFGSMKDSLMSLDFEEAAGKAKMFQQTLGSISPATIGNSIKGLISVVGSLSKAFISFGISLLANPIFLLVAAIVAIVAIIALVMNKLGILKPVLQAVGKVFGWIGDAIDMVVQGFKDLTDWLGLTTNAANDAAQTQADAAEKTAKAHEDKSATIVQGYDHEIAMAKINGKSTEYLEKKKAFWIMETMKARMIADKAALSSAIQQGDLDEEEIQKLKEKAAASTLAYKGQVNDTKQLIAQQSADKKAALLKDQEEEDKATGDAKKKAQEAYKAKLAAEKQFREDRLAAIRLIEDLQFEVQEEGITKELALNKTKHERILEDLANNAKLTADEKKRLTELYAEQELQTEKEIRDKYALELQTALNTANANREAKKEEEKAKRKQDAIDKAEADKVAAEKEIATLQAVADAKNAIQNANLQLATQGIGLLKGVFEKNKAIQKGLLIAENAAGIAKIIINTAAANAAVTLKYALIPGGPILAAGEIARNKIGAAIGIASAIAATAKGLAALGGGTATGGTPPSNAGGGGSSSTTATQQSTPTVTLNGANNNANTFGANGQQQGGQMVVKAVVVESDVTSMQNKMNKIQQSAVL